MLSSSLDILLDLQPTAELRGDEFCGCVSVLASVLRFVGIFWKIVVGSYLVGGVEVMLRNDFSEEMQVLLLLYPRASERKAGFPHGLLREEFSWAAHPNPPQSHVKGSG